MDAVLSNADRSRALKSGPRHGGEIARNDEQIGKRCLDGRHDIRIRQDVRYRQVELIDVGLLTHDCHLHAPADSPVP